MAQRRIGIGCRRQDQLGIAQIKQAFFTVTFEHVLGQGHVTAPDRNCSFELAILLPGQITHRDTRQLGQTLDYQRMRRNTAAKTLPGVGVSRSIDNAPATLAPALKSIEHQDSAVRSVTCGRCQNVSRTA